MTPNTESLLKKLILVTLVGSVIWSVILTAFEYQSPNPQLFKIPVKSTEEPTPHKGIWIEKVEPYELKALVLSRKTYRDQNGDVAPLDLALAWGKLTDPSLAGRLYIQQYNRFFYWTLPPNQPLSPGEVISQTANVHMISLSEEQTNSLLEIKKGDLIACQGYLVNIHRDNNIWKTSRTRTDTGAGACEIFLTTRIEVLQRNLLR